MNISDLIDQYEQGARLRGLAPTQMNALKPVRRALGHVPPGKLTPTIAGHYVYDRRCGAWSEVHGNRPAADGTIRRELGALSAVLNWAHQKRILKDAPPSIDLPPMSPPREVFLNKEEADDLWDAADYVVAADGLQRDVGLFVCLALDTWARAASIEGLTWNRVDLARGQIDYREPGRAETSKRRVPVPMSRRLRTVLTIPSDQPRTEFVCGPVTQHQWRAFKERAGIRQDITRHDLRRTGISLAIAAGKDIAKVAQAAGDDITTIQKHYLRFAPDFLDGLMD